MSNGHGDSEQKEQQNGSGDSVTELADGGGGGVDQSAISSTVASAAAPASTSDVIKQQIRQQQGQLSADQKPFSKPEPEAFNSQDKFQPGHQMAVSTGAPGLNPLAPAEFYRNGGGGGGGDFGNAQFEQMQQHPYTDHQQEISSITYGQPPPHHMQQVHDIFLYT